MHEVKLKEDYRRAACCSPSPPMPIVGYYSLDNVIKIHRTGCGQIGEIDSDRLITLSWADVIEDAGPFEPDDDYRKLDRIDFAVLRHHLDYGVDYSLVVARKVNISRQEAFDRHRKLRDLNLIQRVEPRIIQYRKGVVDNKWIKHRNHTYYNLTKQGRSYIDHFLANLDE